ncbi:MAG: RNA recognition motif domain-containing protein [Lacibacter sp.]
MNLFVAGLPYDVDDAELEEIFEKFGPVKSAKVAIDKATGKSRGFGFVDMENEEDGQQAIELLNDIQLGRSKKPLVVKAAEDRSQGGGGGFNRGPRTGGGSGGPHRGSNGFNRGGHGGSFNRSGGKRDGGYEKRW